MKVHSRPWEHIVVDSLLTEEFRDSLSSLIKTRIDNNKFGYAFLDPSDLLYQNYRATVESNLNIFLDLLECRPYTELHLVDHLTINHPEYSYPVHCEHPAKIISLVTYIYPDNSVGTKLYNSEDGPCVKEITWVPGTTFIFAGKDNVTWHSYCSNNNPRATLCSFFITSINEFNQWKQHEIAKDGLQ